MQRGRALRRSVSITTRGKLQGEGLKRVFGSLYWVFELKNDCYMDQFSSRYGNKREWICDLLLFLPRVYSDTNYIAKHLKSNSYE